jgi:hypothetical protein
MSTITYMETASRMAERGHVQGGKEMTKMKPMKREIPQSLCGIQIPLASGKWLARRCSHVAKNILGWNFIQACIGTSVRANFTRQPTKFRNSTVETYSRQTYRTRRRSTLPCNMQKSPLVGQDPIGKVTEEAEGAMAKLCVPIVEICVYTDDGTLSKTTIKKDDTHV